jgi:hypothetical protein
LSGTIFNGDEIDTKMNIAGQIPMMPVTDSEEQSRARLSLRVYRSKPESVDRFEADPTSDQVLGMEL